MDKGKLSRMANALAAIRTQISQIETCLFAEEEPSKKTTKGERDWSKHLAKPIGWRK
jgi:hypothetical protein